MSHPLVRVQQCVVRGGWWLGVGKAVRFEGGVGRGIGWGGGGGVNSQIGGGENCQRGQA